MRILIAPDKFKGALNAREVAESIAAGLREVLPDAEMDVAPMADGGEGTAEVISDALGGSWLKCKAHDPLGREIEAHYAWIDDHPPSPRLRRDTGKLAVMEMSEAAGMRRLRPNEFDVDLASTFGVGENYRGRGCAKSVARRKWSDPSVRSAEGRDPEPNRRIGTRSDETGGCRGRAIRV